MQALAATKNNKNWFSKTEGRLYAYSVLMASHRELVEKLKEAYPLGRQGQDTAGSGAAYIYGDKTASWVLKMESMEKACDESLSVVIKEFKLMQGFLELSSPDEQTFVEMRYFKNWARSTILREMAISSTTYYRLRETALRRAATIFGYLKYEEYKKMLAL